MTKDGENKSTSTEDDRGSLPYQVADSCPRNHGERHEMLMNISTFSYCVKPELGNLVQKLREKLSKTLMRKMERITLCEEQEFEVSGSAWRVNSVRRRGQDDGSLKRNKHVSEEHV